MIEFTKVERMAKKKQVLGVNLKTLQGWKVMNTGGIRRKSEEKQLGKDNQKGVSCGIPVKNVLQGALCNQ